MGYVTHQKLWQCAFSLTTSPFPKSLKSDCDLAYSLETWWDLTTPQIGVVHFGCDWWWNGPLISSGLGVLGGDLSFGDEGLDVPLSGWSVDSPGSGGYQMSVVSSEDTTLYPRESGQHMILVPPLPSFAFLIWACEQ